MVGADAGVLMLQRAAACDVIKMASCYVTRKETERAGVDKCLYCES